MDGQKLDFFHKCINNAFQKVASEMTGINFTPVKEVPESGEKKFSLIVGLVGQNKGRILLELNERLALKVFEEMNGATPDDDLDLYFYLAEFANIVSGNGITGINNMYKGSELRLTPPAIFAGKNLEITSPKVNSMGSAYLSDYGTVRLEIGIEGV
jgi:CheY-specific phosphatase CheX